MQAFSEAYRATQIALGNGQLDPAFAPLQAALARLVATPDGPDAAHAGALEALRVALDRLAATKVSSATRARAKAICEAAGAGHGQWWRAATLKLFDHLHHQLSAGGQQIWVYAPPEIYAKWIYEELAGLGGVPLEDALAKASADVYSPQQRAIMADAVKHARTLAMGATARLASGDARTRALVRRYFGDAASTGQQVDDASARLVAGFKRIANACNSGKIVISDEPHARTGGQWHHFAFVYAGEPMNVIYLQGAWLSVAGTITPTNQDPMLRCVRTILHELSHKECGTDDVCYGPTGLMSHGSAVMTPAWALHNADSWAYFALEACDRLQGQDRAHATSPATVAAAPKTRLMV